MNHRLRFLLFAAVLPGLVAALPAADRFDRTKARIDALLARRLHPPPAPDKLANPFTLVGTGPVGYNSRGALFAVTPEPAHTAKVDAAGVPLTGDDDVLTYFSGMLKINGQVQVYGQPLLIINQSPYKEGDLVQMHAKDGVTYFLRVIKISPTDVTIGYNEATHTIPLRN